MPRPLLRPLLRGGNHNRKCDAASADRHEFFSCSREPPRAAVTASAVAKPSSIAATRPAVACRATGALDDAHTHGSGSGSCSSGCESRRC